MHEPFVFGHVSLSRLRFHSFDALGYIHLKHLEKILPEPVVNHIFPSITTITHFCSLQRPLNFLCRYKSNPSLTRNPEHAYALIQY